MGDFFETDLLPYIPGVYRKDYISHRGRGKEERQVDAVLLSHGHMDHAAYVHHLRPDRELVMSRETHAVLKTIQDTDSGGYSEYLDLTPQLSDTSIGAGQRITPSPPRDPEQPLSITI